MNVPAVKPDAGLGRRELMLFAAAAFAVPLLFALYTGHIWEDYFITFLHSQNLVDGHGLVYRAGERVHGFTSPLGTLLPALCYWVTGHSSYLPALWLFRVFSAAAFAGGGVLFLQALRAAGTGKYVCVAFAVLYLLDVKAVDFSVNGMETGFMLLFLGWGVYLLARDELRHWPAVGLMWAGLMWTRPDGCVYIAALALAGLVFGPGRRRPRLAALAKAAAVCAVLYLPWFLWAWSYYGSPVPNTIRAKAANLGDGYEDWGHTLLVTLQRWPDRAADVFRPTYLGFGGWDLLHKVLPQYLALFGLVYWLFPVNDRLGRQASFCFALLTLYLAFLHGAYPWYLPPVEVCGLLALTRGGVTYVRSLSPGRALPVRLAGAALVLLAAFSLWTFGLTAWQMKVQQEEVEWGNRVPLAQWLKEHVGPGERVYTESLGYIGYFSGAKMLDYPGLASAEVMRESRRKPNNFFDVGLRLRPEWMVLRPGEAETMALYPEFSRHYKRAAPFEATDRLNQYSFIPGKGYVVTDATFTVYQRLPEGGAAASGSE
jgi:hypothetical protein